MDLLFGFELPTLSRSLEPFCTIRIVLFSTLYSVLVFGVVCDEFNLGNDLGEFTYFVGVGKVEDDTLWFDFGVVIGRDGVVINVSEIIMNSL